MKKPNKEKQLICHYDTSWLPTDQRLSSGFFRELADSMDNLGISFLELDIVGNRYDDYPHLDVVEYKYETEGEARKRYNKEAKEYAKYKENLAKAEEKRKKSLIKEAKKLGLKITE